VPYAKKSDDEKPSRVFSFLQQDPALQEATASEPLTLDEEYDMQKSWAEDHKSKLQTLYCMPFA
jgi:hypothetical protein